MICFIVLEAGYSLIFKQDYLWQYDEYLGSIHIPGKKGMWCRTEFCHNYTVNSCGFLDDEFKINKTSGEKRILIFGDSMMEAVHVYHTNKTHFLLEKKLKTINEKYSVYNFGIAGQGPAQYLLALFKYGPVFKPDIVIFAIYPGNDFKSLNPILCEKDGYTSMGPYYIWEHNKLHLKRDRQKKPNTVMNMLKKSKILNFIILRLSVIDRKMRTFSETIPVEFLVYDPNNKEYNKSFMLNEKIMLAAKNFTNELGSKFILVTLATDVHLDKNKWNQTIKTYPAMQNKTWNLEFPIQKLEKFCENSNISCLHLLYPFQEYVASTGKELHFYKNRHWNENGHKLAASEIFKYLNETGLINTNGK